MSSPSTQTPHRKIELQSPTDLIYLHSLATSLSAKHLSLAYPPSLTTPDDALRARVETLLTDFIDKTYEGVRGNVSVNGVSLLDTQGGSKGEGVEGMVEYEGFDNGMAERLRKAEEKRSALIGKVAEMRRVGGSKAAEKWVERWEKRTATEGNVGKDRQAQSGALEMDVKIEDADMDVDEVEQIKLDIGPLDRWDEVTKMHEKALEGLVELKSGMAGTVGKLAEAKRVGDELGEQ